MNRLDRFDKSTLTDNPRATFPAWQRYEELILSAYRSYPKPFLWDPTSSRMSCQTVISRARDAVRGKVAFDWPSTVSSVDLAEWFNKISFREVRGLVWIGPRELKRPTINVVVSEERQEGYTLTTTSIKSIDSFAWLLSQGEVSGPIIIKNPPTILSYPNYPNFQHLTRPDGSLVLL